MTIRKNWKTEELALVLNLYCTLPFGKMHTHNPEIIKLAAYLNRTPGSIAMKLANFASLDPTLKQKGLTACSKLDRLVWQQFFRDENIVEQTETICETLSPETLKTDDYSADDTIVSASGRKLQGFFRKTILANYRHSCCITGIDIPTLLVASHIIPWSTDKNIRVHPQNGLCLNVLHDKAFDKGLMTIDSDFKIVISPSVMRKKSNTALWDWEGKKISLPEKFLPSIEFLEYHQKHIFIK